MLHPAFAKCAATNFPTADAAGKDHLHRIWGRVAMVVQAVREPKLGTGAPQQTHRRLCQKLFAGPVYQAQLLLQIKSKNGHIDL
jgi:hypothetical protein